MFRVEAGCITTNASAPFGGWPGVAPCPPAFQTGALLRELDSHRKVATARLARASSWIQTRRLDSFTLVALLVPVPGTAPGSSAYRADALLLSYTGIVAGPHGFEP